MSCFDKIMFVLFNMLLLFFGNMTAIAQEGFQLPEGEKRDRFSFRLINNLIIVPVELNGVKLSFLLDTGVDKTLLFGVRQQDSVELKNAKKIKIRGLGGQESKDALRSYNNTLQLGSATDQNHTVFVLFDEMIDFSKYMGVPIHGIIGYEYFKDFEVTVKYGSQRIRTQNSKSKRKRPCRKCEQLPLELYKNKPYVSLKVNGRQFVPMLIDSGSSDALWLFDATPHISEQPKNYFNDFLGYTLSGAIFGKRSRIDSFDLGKFHFKEITTAFPEALSFDGIVLKEERGGSIGGGLLSRFKITVDYTNAVITLKKNNKYKDPFNYDLSGMTLIYDGSYSVKELQDVKNEGLSIAFSGKEKNRTSSNTIRVAPISQLFTAPKVIIAALRVNSPAALAGLVVGDALIKINGQYSYTYELYEITALFRKDVGKKIIVEYERDNKLIKASFKLKRQL